MFRSKPAARSKAVIASVVVIGASIAGMFGFALTPEQQQEISDLILAVVTGIGGLVALYGRVVAKTEIKGIIKQPQEETNA